MGRIVSAWLVVTLLGLNLVDSAFGAEPSEVLKLIPPSANSIAILKIQDLVHSPRGKAEGWAKKHQTEFLAGSIHIPPTVDFVLRGFEFHPEDTRWTNSYGIASWKQQVTMARIAEHEKVKVENVAGHAVIQTERNSYFAMVGPGLVGVINPAYRQNLARWLRQIDAGKENGPSAYLKDATAQIGEAQIMLALDFQDLVDPKSWNERIKTSSAIFDKPNVVSLMTNLTDSLRGVSLKVLVTDKTTGIITLDFNTKVSQTAKPYLIPVLMDLLGEAGATLDELPNGQVDTQDKTATITFELSDVGVRKIMSMITMPTVSEPSADQTASASDSGAVNAAASKAYYRAITQILDDLSRMNEHASNYLKTATWHDNFARKIDQLAIRGVDLDLQTYGRTTSAHLRALAASLRGVPLDVRRLQSGITYNVDFQTAGIRPYGNSIWSSVGYQPGYVNVQTNQSQIRAQQADAVAAGAKQRTEIWQAIADDRQQIRARMQEKFQQDFDAAK